MTKKHRQLVYELIAILAAGFFGAFAVPELFNAHDSIAALAGIVLLVGWLGWVTYFIFRVTQQEGLMK